MELSCSFDQSSVVNFLYKIKHIVKNMVMKQVGSDRYVSQYYDKTLCRHENNYSFEHCTPTHSNIGIYISW